jgi:hypothetical protein
MNGPDSKLSDCGCCEGVEKLTPALPFNPPGLSALAYRVGTHSGFKQSMQVDLTRSAQLRALKTRRDDDPTIGLLDAWATTLDVLTFYQERIANEGYLRTATERRSLLELARAIGYELRPGVAASTYLAFTMETAAGAPRQATLTAGVKAQSVPEQGQQAQIFETVEEITARPERNKLLPRTTQPQELLIDGTTLRYAKTNSEVGSLYFKGTSTGLAPGDLLVVTTGTGSNTKALAKRVLRVKPDDDAKRTKVEIEATATSPENLSGPAPTTAFDTIQFAPNAPPVPFTKTNINVQVLSRRLRERDLETFLELNRWQANDLEEFVAKELETGSVPEQAIFVCRERAGFFGNNAPLFSSLRNKDGDPLFVDDWDNPGWKIWDAYPNEANLAASASKASASKAASTSFSLGAGLAPINIFTGAGAKAIERGYSKWSSVGPADAFLERSIPGIVPDSWAVFSVAGMPQIYHVSAVHELSLIAFAMSGKATGLKLRTPAGEAITKSPDFLVRTTTAYVKSEPLDLAALPITDIIPAGTTALTLERIVLGLQPGQLVVITGEQQDAPGVTQNELLELEEVIHYQGVTTLLFHEESTLKGLRYSYLRSTVKLNANVARATHGETKSEVLGSGKASQVWQKFLLKQSPLTYVSAPTPTGLASTVQLRVNDVLWEEAPRFYGLPSKERKYVVRRNDENKSTVQFGDGKTGARLPSGVENITANYRAGIGLGGMVNAGQISLLLSRPLGLKEVINPLPASGGADAEAREQARENAPFTVLTLERIVSLQDFEDFARSYPGIGKAQAVWLWDGENKIIHITIAGADGSAVAATSELYENLGLSIKAARDPGYRVQIDSFEPLSFNLLAKLLVTHGYLADKVTALVIAAVRSAFSFERRGFGQAVTRSELLAVMQRVDGVEAVDLDMFHFSSKAASLEKRLPARVAQWNETHSVIRAAELLLVNPREIQLTEMKP